MLLTGARGTGKSSLIRACLNEWAAQGLRLIEVDKADLPDLPDIMALVAGRPEKFIIYCDDLSFDEGEPGYKALKSALDGSVAAAAPNALIYATSNRRHLLPETMRDNLAARHDENGELHPGEAIEEKVSLSERFGLWASFYPFSQDEYLRIAAQWLAALGASPAQIAAARPEALIWALFLGSLVMCWWPYLDWFAIKDIVVPASGGEAIILNRPWYASWTFKFILSLIPVVLGYTYKWKQAKKRHAATPTA